MSFTDILTIPFLISLGITLLLLALISMFFLQKMNEQNHKFSSMMGLVTTMAEELNFIRGRLQFGQPQALQPSPIQRQGGSKIPVSDDEEEDDSDDEDDDESDDDEEDDESDDDDEEDDEDSSSETQEKNIKIINMSEKFDINYENLNNTEVDSTEEIQDEPINELDDLELGEDDLDSEDDKEDDEKEIITISNNDLLKSINLTEESLNKKEFEIQDYKKMSLSKLKETVVEKGLTQDASKMNKNKLLTLLGVK